MNKPRNYFLDRLPEEAKKTVVKRKLVLKETTSPKSQQNLYSKKRQLFCEDGYDILQNLIVVRHYVTKRYEITFHLLELLVYLFPWQYFTHTDYGVIPKSFSFRSLTHMEKLGWVVIAQNGHNREKHLYCLSRNAKEIVKHFYQVLSGEKRIPEAPINPLTNTNKINNTDKKRMILIKRLNQLEIPATKKTLFS